MKMTSEEFDKAVTRREVKSAEFVSLLADSLRELAAPGVEAGKGTVDNAWNRLILSLTDMSNIIYQGFKPAIVSAILIVKDLIDSFWWLWDIVGALGKLFGVFIAGFRVVTALIGDLLDPLRRAKLISWFEKGMPGLKSSSDFNKQVVEHRVVVAPSEQAKKDLEIKQEQQMKNFWGNFSMEIQ